MSYLVSSKFSTLDQDSDESCAQLDGAGWWFTNDNCTQANLNGLYNNFQLAEGKQWTGFGSPKFSEMMVRPYEV